MTTKAGREPYATGDTLMIAETFGLTVQGEGPNTGRTASFIRTGGCNLQCKWCDSAFTWDASRFDLRAEMARIPVADVLAEVEGHGAALAVITGGEPLLHQQQEGWRTLLDGLKAMGRFIEVETNGTIRPDTYTASRIDGFNVSPKLAHAGMTGAKRIRPDVLSAFAATGKANFKFVCRTAADVDTVAALVADLVADTDFPADRVWIMPEGQTAQELAVTTPNVVEQALHYRFNFSTRLHITLWGSERGH